MGLFKLLAFVLVIWVAWRLAKALIGPLLAQSVAPSAPKAESGKAKIQDMFECPTCKTYITASSKRCDRFDCPR